MSGRMTEKLSVEHSDLKSAYYHLNFEWTYLPEYLELEAQTWREVSRWTVLGPVTLTDHCGVSRPSYKPPQSSKFRHFAVCEKENLLNIDQKPADLSKFRRLWRLIWWSGHHAEVCECYRTKYYAAASFSPSLSSQLQIFRKIRSLKVKVINMLILEHFKLDGSTESLP